MRPELSQPVTWDKVFDELGFVLESAKISPQVTVTHHAPLDKIHSINPRRYAQVRMGNSGVTVELADAIRKLPPEHRLGLYAHEVGHILSPTGGEVAADRAAYERLGVVIGYDDRWPGKGLQVALDAPPWLRGAVR